MKDYVTYDAADFALDEDFVKWVKHPDSRSNAFWNDWLARHPLRRFEVAEARRIIEVVMSERVNAPSAYQKKTIWSAIESVLGDSSEALLTKKYKNRNVWTVAIVAILIGIASGGIWLFKPLPVQPLNKHTAFFKDRNFIERINNSDKPLTMILEDGSSIILQPNSCLSYPENFSDNQREVYLEGEAFFEITKNPQRPFLVYANELVTKVLGTSFSVRSFTNEPDIVVEVRSGKVSVFSANQNDGADSTGIQREGLVLTPNQQAVYTKENAKLLKSLFENPSLLSVPNSSLSFNFVDTPMKEVFSELEEAYGVEIVYDEEVMKDCLMNASLADESLKVKLTLICRAVNATYEIIDTHIIIYAKGCQEDYNKRQPTPI